MSNNAVNKRKGAGTDSIIILGTGAIQKAHELDTEGKYSAPTLDGMIDKDGYVSCKYEQNTEKDVEKRNSKKRQVADKELGK